VKPSVRALQQVWTAKNAGKKTTQNIKMSMKPHYLF